MAVLIMSDGGRRNVSYNQAAKVYQVLMGIEKPEDNEQKDFVSQVKEVIFDATSSFRTTHAGSRRRIDSDRKKPDKEIRKIIRDKTLTGREKAIKIAQRIKMRESDEAIKIDQN